MPSTQINARMDISDHGLSHPFRSMGVVENGLLDIKIVFVKCLFIFNDS